MQITLTEYDDGGRTLLVDSEIDFSSIVGGEWVHAFEYHGETLRLCVTAQVSDISLESDYMSNELDTYREPTYFNMNNFPAGSCNSVTDSGYDFYPHDDGFNLGSIPFQ